MCRIMMDDSKWLDSYQQSVLTPKSHSGTFLCPVEPAKQLEVQRDLTEVDDCPTVLTKTADSVDECCTDQHQPAQSFIRSISSPCSQSLRKSKSLDKNFVFSRVNSDRHTVTAHMTVIDKLPAPEFVKGLTSEAVVESARLLATVASMYGPNSCGTIS